jgi:hypothetical protein
MKYERVFCANCAKEGGHVSADWSPHVFFLCDDCFLTGGTPPECTQVSAETEKKIRGG